MSATWRPRAGSSGGASGQSADSLHLTMTAINEPAPQDATAVGSPLPTRGQSRRACVEAAVERVTA
jgi:hypothetical protein